MESATNTVFGRDSKTGRGVGNLQGKKGRLQCALIGGSWDGETAGGLTSSLLCD